VTSESPQGPKLENRGSKIAASFEFRVSLARHPSLLTHDRGQQVSGFRLERLGRRQAGSALGARDSALRERRLGFLHFRSLKLAWRGLRPQRVERPLPTLSLPSCSNLIRRQLSMASRAFLPYHRRAFFIPNPAKYPLSIVSECAVGRGARTELQPLPHYTQGFTADLRSMAFSPGTQD
jgi:hypothetical protein